MSVFRKTILQNPNADRVPDIKIYGSGTTIFDVAGSAGLEFNTESTGGLNFKIGGSAGLYINDNISGTPTSCGGFQLDLRGGGGTILFKNGIGTDIYSTLNLDANNNFSLSGVDNSGLGKALGITGNTTAGLFLSNNVDSTSISLLMTGDSGSIVLNASGTGSGIDIDSNNGISVENQTAGDIDITNAGGDVRLTPKDGSPVILEKRQVRTTKSIINTDSPYSAADELYILADTSAGVITVNLPAAVAGLIYKIKNSDTTSAGNAVTVAPAAGTIDGAANATLNALEAKEFVCDGTNWWII